jgi:hypothetical protein
LTDYGPIRSAPIIERAAARTLGEWFGAYLGETLVQAGFDRYGLPTPDDIVRVVDTGSWPMESNLAVAMIAVSSMEALRQGGGMYGASISLRAGVATTYEDYAKTREAAQLYAAATLCLAHKGLDGFDEAVVTWEGEGYERLRETDERTLMLGVGLFTVSFPDARAMFGGPDEPPDDPDDRPEGTPPTLVETVNVDADKL